MSRVGRNPIPLPSAVEVKVEAGRVTVAGPRGNLAMELPRGITLSCEEREARVERPDDARSTKALHGLTRALVANMVAGVTTGFVKELEIVGVGYRAIAKGPSELELALGFSHPVGFNAPDGITFEVPAPTRIRVIGIDKELVGQVAANIRKIRKPEPYKGKGVRYAGERVARKAGKAAK